MAVTQARNSMKKLCEKDGVRTGEAQLEFARKKPHNMEYSPLPVEEQLDCWQAAINDFKANNGIPA